MAADWYVCEECDYPHRYDEKIPYYGVFDTKYPEFRTISCRNREGSIQLSKEDLDALLTQNKGENQ